MAPGALSDYLVNIYSQCFAKNGFNPVKEFKTGADGLISLQTMLANKNNTKETHILIGYFGMIIFGNYPNISIDQDFILIAQAVQLETVIYTKAGKYNNLQEVLSEINRRPITLGYFSQTYKLMGEKLFEKNKSNLVSVPYKGPIQVATDIIGDNIDISIELWSNVKSFVEQGKVQVLAATVPPERAKSLNTVSTDQWDPTLSQIPLGLGFLTNVGTDQKILSRLRDSVLECNTSPEFVSRIRNLQAVPVTKSPNEVIKLIKDARQRFSN